MAISTNIILSVVIVLCGFTLCNAVSTVSKTYTGSGNQVTNPERGFRWERGSPYVTNFNFDNTNNLTITQVYVYLNDYVGKDIPQSLIDDLNTFFSIVRASGLKTLFRFAYENAATNTVGPTFSTIATHLAQLKPVIRNNSDVIYVVQVGLVGLWGEWHHSVNNLEANNDGLANVIYQVVNDLIPSNRKVQVRKFEIKQSALTSNVTKNALWFPGVLNSSTAYTSAFCNRIGFHNDAFGSSPMDSGTFSSTSMINAWTVDSAYVPVDGEMLWDQINLDNNAALLRLREHHYTTFSHSHSYSFDATSNDALNVWKNTALNTTFLKAAKMPLSPSYEAVSHTIWDYVRDHLGYRYELKSANYPFTLVAGSAFNIQFSLVNYGFSAMINSRPVYIVLINAAGSIVLTSRTSADPTRWQPYVPGDSNYVLTRHNQAHSFNLPTTIAAGDYKVGVYMPDSASTLSTNSKFAVRFANKDVTWWTDANGKYGVNVIGTFTVGTSSSTSGKLLEGEFLSYQIEESSASTAS